MTLRTSVTRTSRSIGSILLTCAALSLSAQKAHAQDQEADPSTEDTPQIIVTARLSDENIKDIPFPVAVIDEDFLESRGLFRVEDAIRLIPGVDINANGSPTLSSVRIRGVGSLYLANRDDTSVSMIVDGVPTATENLALSTLDISRIEVLKGPQSNIYGQNSEAGAINITTNRPTDALEVDFRGRYGEEGQYLAEGIVSGPLSDNVGARIAVRQTAADHWIENANTGEPVTTISDFAVRGQLFWESGATSARLIGEYYDSDDQIAIQILRPYEEQPTYSLTPGLFEDNEKALYRGSLNITHDFSFGRLTSVSAYTTYDLFNEAAIDTVLNEVLFGFPIESVAIQTADDETISQDIRLTALPGSDVFWILGVSFIDTSREFMQVDTMTLNSTNTQLDTTRYGVFGEVTYPLTDRLKITGGLRLSYDEKDFAGLYQGGGFSVPDARDLEDTYVTGRAAISYDISGETTIYGLYARGYKTGGFNEFATQPADSVPFDPARVTTLEAGFKTISADLGLRLNGAVFYNDVTDDHLLGFDPFTFASNVLNADTRSLGAEFDVVWEVLDGLTVSGGLVYLDAEITSDVTGVFGGDVSDGNGAPDVPDWSGVFSVDWRYPLADVLGGRDTALETAITYSYQGTRPADVQNNFDLNAYNKLDLRIGVSNEWGRIYFWGDNLLDEQFDLYGFGFGFPGGESGAPARRRTVGVGLDLSFR